MRRGSISPKLIMCGGSVRIILLLSLVARCLETTDVYIWRMFACMSVVLCEGMWEYPMCSGRCWIKCFFSLWVLEYSVCCVGDVMDVMDVAFSVLIVRRGAVGARVWEVIVCLRAYDVLCVMCVHPVDVLNTAVCMTYSVFMLVEDGRGILQCRYRDILICTHEFLLLCVSLCCGSAVIKHIESLFLLLDLVRDCYILSSQEHYVGMVACIS